ncbi:bifunctional diguanylate cyclase/phosphodiesterase [Azohydromonas lata]|uniref:bifunctional diguanylate cyclase/phosphodiesterase n=1 Tax=Azohydromonas lata TaxID=45677 RepID=UPI0009FBFC58|nr:EAL domain-containing protein [Azohydromonas lata]
MPRVIPPLFGRLRVGPKLLVLSLLPLVLTAGLGGMLVRDRLRIADGAKQELAGLACLGEVQRVLIGSVAPEATGASRRSTALMLQAPSCAETAGGRFSQALERLSQDPAQQMAGLPGRAALAALRVEVLRQGETVVERVAWDARLGASPALDQGRHALPIVVSRLPELMVLAQRMQALLLAAAVPHGTPGVEAVEDWRSEFYMLEGQLVAQARLLELDGQHARNTNDEQLAAALAWQTQMLGAIEDFGRSGRTLAQGNTNPTEAALQPLDVAFRALLTQVEQHATRLSAPLAAQLEQRVQQRKRKLVLELGGGGAVLLVLLVLSLRVARQITRPLEAFAEVARALRRSGDTTRRLEWDAQDEFGQVAQAFNQTLSRLTRKRAERDELQAALETLQSQTGLGDVTPLPLVVTSLPAHEVLHANAAGLELTGRRRQDPWSLGLDADTRAQLARHLGERGQVDGFEVRWQMGAQALSGVVSQRRLVYNGRDAVLTVFTPVERLRAAEQGLSMWAQVYEAATEALAIFDQQRQLVSLNGALSRLTACRTDAVVGRGLERLLAEDTEGEFVERFWRSVEGQGRWQGEMQLRRSDGRSVPVWVVASVISDVASAEGPRRFTLFSAVDVSERQAQEQRIRYLAHHDALTGLPNRVLFLERLRAMVQRARLGESQVAVLCIGVDRFRQINDSLGRAGGDALLRAVAQRLVETLRAGDVACRLGGDEFAVALGGLQDGEEALRLVEQRFLPQLRRAYAVNGVSMEITCSVGVAPCLVGVEAEEAMRRADAAVAQASGKGGDAASLFTAEVHERAHRRVMLESQLKLGLERGEFSLLYQPRVAARDGALVGVEALLRWNSARLGEVSAMEFVPVAEASKQIVPIGAWVLDQVCRQLAQWRAREMPHLHVAVNLSPVQLRDPALLETLRSALQRHGVAAAQLELEFTEAAVMEDVEFMLAQFVALKQLGVGLSIDDFGTGYSSVPHLNRFPVDRLKVDRTLVAALARDLGELAVVRAIVGLGHTMGLQVTAEGVEDEATAEVLRGAECDEFQGYHYARPLSVPDLEAWIGQLLPPTPPVTRGEVRPILQLLTRSDAA